MTSQILNIGLIGAGRIGKVHAANLTTRIPSARIVAVADVMEEAARQCAQQFGISTAVNDYHKLLENPDITAVVICSATDTHARIIGEAAQAGKQIFCEKPISFDLATIDQALQAVAQAGVKLQVGFNRRFDSNYARIRQAIVQGEIGQLSLLHIISRDPAPPPIEYVKVSGGLFMDMTVHDFDMARFLTGSEVEEVYAAATVMVDPAIGEAGDVDTAVITLKFENGIIGTIDNSRQAIYGYDQRVEVLGNLGGANTENNYPNSAVISGRQSIYRDLPLNFFMERYTESFVAEMSAFVDAVLNDKPVPVTGQDGRATALLALACRKSYLENRPVKLKEIEN
jgi:myo-inositol 2-dehydrogenase/D-chiro-inositol 1-dehydrogenase